MSDDNIEFLRNHLIQNYIYVNANLNIMSKYYNNFIFYIINMQINKKIILYGYIIDDDNKLYIQIYHSIKLKKFFEYNKVVEFCGMITCFENKYYCYMPNIGHKSTGLHINHNKTIIKKMISIIETLPSLKDILLDIVIPKNIKSIQSAVYQLLIYEIAIKRKIVQDNIVKKIPKNIDNIDIKMPFELNEYQKTVLKDIQNNLKSDNKTSHLIYGDVGSGKTILAYIAACIVYNNNQNVVILVPNLILVKQVANNFRKWNNTLNIIEVTSSIKKISCDKIGIFIGTNALLNRNISNIGLLIVDEQQKFGVIQRNKLLDSNTDLIMLSATPIPRTLQMALLGLLSYSILNKEKIKNYMQIGNLSDIDNIVQNILQKSYYTKIFWVEATIENAIERQKEFILLGQNNTELVHSKIKNRQDIIADFINKECGILIGTTVLEVGIDSDINNIVIINADMMGLSQLHQLNGRVGRRGIPGNVILVGKNLKKLKSIKELDNGFEIAKWDLRQRGGSNMLKLSQSGFEEFLFNYTLKDNLTWEYSHVINNKFIDISNNKKLNNEIIQFICGNSVKIMNNNDIDSIINFKNDSYILSY